jgi:hypothetical protein
MRVIRWLDELGEDLKVAVRQLKSSPAFTLVATLVPDVPRADVLRADVPRA